MTKKYKADSFIFPCYQPVDRAFYKWRKRYDNKPIVFIGIDDVTYYYGIEPRPILTKHIDANSMVKERINKTFEHMSELERKLTKVYE